ATNVTSRCSNLTIGSAEIPNSLLPICPLTTSCSVRQPLPPSTAPSVDVSFRRTLPSLLTPSIGVFSRLISRCHLHWRIDGIHVLQSMFLIWRRSKPSQIRNSRLQGNLSCEQTKKTIKSASSSNTNMQSSKNGRLSPVET
ncbi:hypothetical protein ES288_D01G160800v1, partial [Gossypium darwinii]